MRSAYESVEPQDKVDETLKLFHHFVIEYIKSSEVLPTELLNIFRALFFNNINSYFYEKYGAIHSNTKKAKEVAGEYAVIPPSGASMYFVGAFNYFGENNGFHEFLKRIERSNIAEPNFYKEFVIFVETIAVCRFCLNKPTWCNIMRDLYRIIATKFEDLTDEERSLMIADSTGYFVYFASAFLKITKNIFTKMRIDEIIETIIFLQSILHKDTTITIEQMIKESFDIPSEETTTSTSPVTGGASGSGAT